MSAHAPPVRRAARAPAVAPPVVHDVLRSPGHPLEAGVRREMEPRLGHSFAGVRVHADARAAESARAVGASAYAVGRDVVFGAGRYAPGSDEGRRLIAHELAHVVQQAGRGPPPARLAGGAPGAAEEREAEAGAPTPRRGPPVLRRQPAASVCFRPGVAEPAAGSCAPVAPEACPTYGQWIAGFEGLRSFSARDTSATGTHPTGHEVLGGGPADPSPSAPAASRPPPVVGHGAGDRFIDHPTDQWVQSCLPANLRETAYRLPSDCADIAVILRHVWLAAHGRTETVGTWTLGSAAGSARRAEVGTIIGQVYSGNVRRMVNPYSDARGNPLRSLASLQNLLHPGDVLVWEHHSGGLGTARTGGHTHTVVSVTRDGAGRITSIRTLQGNQPIFSEQSTEIRAADPSAPSAAALGGAPGRRIEADSLSGGSLRDLTLPARRGSTTPGPAVWTWSDGHTTLVAAGPPASAPRPAMRTVGGQRVRRLSDWHAPLRSASAARLLATLESALQEMRASVEGGQAVAEADARALGTAAGERLWALAGRAGDLGEESHFLPLQRIRAVITALGATTGPGAAAVSAAFGQVDDAFNLAARGASTVRFPTGAAPRGVRRLHMLVTGFDPFNTDNAAAPPRRGEWNPSGAAAMALDGTTVDGPGTARTAVEGVVLPVSFPEFAGGLVERVVGPHAQATDAVVTVSLDPEIGPQQAVRLERWAVGVHRLLNGTLAPVPAAPGGAAGPAFVESPAPLDRIADETAQPAARGRPEVPRPAIGEDVHFRFASVAAANAALAELGLPAATTAQVKITSPAALRRIAGVMQRGTDATVIDFNLGGAVTHRARVLAGPGGDFLSNEVSFRVIRLLASAASPRDPMSFHVHTQVGSVIPQDTSTPAARTARTAALAAARGVRTRLIATLRRVIRATAAAILRR